MIIVLFIIFYKDDLILVISISYINKCYFFLKLEDKESDGLFSF